MLPDEFLSTELNSNSKVGKTVDFVEILIV